MSTIDMGKFAEPRNIETLPEGTYKVMLIKWEKAIARTGTEQIRYYATVVEGEQEGKSLIDHIALSEKAFWRVAWFIKEALGWEKEDMQAVGNIDVGSEKFNRCFDLAKQRCMWWVVTVDKTYNNNKVVEYLPDAEVDKVNVDDIEDVPTWVKSKGDKKEE